jgi:hypothetical protein
MTAPLWSTWGWNQDSRARKEIHCGKEDAHRPHRWLAYAGPGVVGGYDVNCPGTCHCGHHRTAQP